MALLAACSDDSAGAGGSTDPIIPDAGGETDDTGRVADDVAETPDAVPDTADSEPDAQLPEDSGPDLPVVDAGDDTSETDAEPDTGPEPLTDPPLPPPYSHGECPVLVGGPTNDTSVVVDFPTGEHMRRFRLMVPEGYDGSEPMPLVFAWHWLNASSSSFVREAQFESAIEQLGLIVVLPDGLENDRGDKAYTFDWPFAEDWGKEAELLFLDDLMSCVQEQYNIDRRRVYGIGVSAGGLWVTYVSTTAQGNYFAAIESLSGGLGEVLGVWEMQYQPQPNKFPAIVLWGGDGDWLGLSFSEASVRYRDALRDDGHFVVQCVHDAGHAVPPIEAPGEMETRFRALWTFMLDHPYGLPPGHSPYLQDGLPDFFPEWCEIVP